MSDPTDTGAVPAVHESRRLRLWPAGILVVGMLAAVFGSGIVAPGTMAQFMAMFFGPMIGGGLLVLWWLFFSKALWMDRILALVVFAAAGGCTWFLAHSSVRPVGLMIHGVCTVATAFFLWLWLANGRFSPRVQRIGTTVVLILATGVWACLRCDGIDGEFASDLSWRWNATREEQFLASLSQDKGPKPAIPPSDSRPLELTQGDWSEFRGEKRDGRVEGVVIDTDWKTNPPKELWRRNIGPGWSSFCIVGTRLFTQEQRGEEEAVICYDAATGEIVWKHVDPTRFTEVVSGPGPRATPTFHEGRIYTLGARGILNALNANDGSSIWRRDLVVDAEASVPEWGFASSPLIVGDLVVVFAGGGPKDVIAYDRESGTPRWTAEAGTLSYSSPQVFESPEGSQILMLTDQGIVSLAPTDGATIWKHDWPIEHVCRIVQPHVVAEDDGSWTVLVGTGYGHGTRKLRVAHASDKWDVEEDWTSTKLKPYFNDFVSRDGYLYGFDGNILACIDLESGERAWKGGRYGSGQLLLLADQNLLLVVSEQGDLALVQADPDRFHELTRIPAIEGKTWNHPVVAHGKLYLRNSEEIACFAVPETDQRADRALDASKGS